jgi:Protein of unknown function DUF72
MDRSPRALRTKVRVEARSSAAQEQKPHRGREAPAEGARAAGTKTKIWIGTSGWSYDGWRGALYPQKLPKKDWLRFYSSQFASTEINASFYRTPSLEAAHMAPRHAARFHFCVEYLARIDISIPGRAAHAHEFGGERFETGILKLCKEAALELGLVKLGRRHARAGLRVVSRLQPIEHSLLEANGSKGRSRSASNPASRCIQISFS